MSYNSDLPVTSSSEDRFSRRYFANGIADVIKKRSDKSSFTIGIYGKWGEGKTTVLNFIQESLISENNILPINYNPWRFEGEDQQLLGLYKIIAERLDVNIAKRKDKLINLYKKIEETSPSTLGIKTGLSVVGMAMNIPSIETFKQRTENILNSTDCRVVIMVDDIDRLERKEIQSLFRLIKLTANFKNTIYILAFDKDIVSQALNEVYSSKNGESGSEFLEKIIQLPLNLPNIEIDSIMKFSSDLIESVLKDYKLTIIPQKELEFHLLFTEAFGTLIDTPRKAYLLTNSLRFAFSILKNEINTIDMILIEAIRLFIPDMYYRIRENKKLLTGYIEDYDSEIIKKENQKLKTSFDPFLNTSPNSNENSIINLLKYLFPRFSRIYSNLRYSSGFYESWNLGKRINSADYFSRYFLYGYSDTDVPDNIIEQYIQDVLSFESNITKENNPLLKYINDSNIEIFLVKLLRVINKESEGLRFYSVIESILHNLDLMPLYEGLSKYYSPYYTTLNITCLILSKIESHVSRNEYLLNIFEKFGNIPDKIDLFNQLENFKDYDSSELLFNSTELEPIEIKISKLIEIEMDQKVDFTLQYMHQLSKILFFSKRKIGSERVQKYFQKLFELDKLSLIRLLIELSPYAIPFHTGIRARDELRRDSIENILNLFDRDFLDSWIPILDTIKIELSIGMIEEIPNVKKEDLDVIDEFLRIMKDIDNNPNLEDDHDV